MATTKQQFLSWDELYAPVQTQVAAQNNKNSRDKGLSNLLSDDYWFISSGTREDSKIYKRSVDYSTIAPGTEFIEENYLYFKYLTLLMLGGYVNQHNKIVSSVSTPITIMKNVVRFIAVCDKPIHLNLWKEQDYKEFFQWIVRKGFESGQVRALDTIRSWMVFSIN